ncbi:MAG: glycosyltransferase family 1 protein, partial [Phycisphaerales bacterium]|nr:glycosyltransferase family 1 protein [Phycisphaerales bacterium]
VTKTWDLRRPPVVFPNFMNFPETLAPLPADDAHPTIVCIGRIEPLKGQDTLAKAFSIIAPRHPGARLVIIGPDRWPGKQRFAELLPGIVPDPAIRSRIDLPGAVPLETVAQMLRDARLAVISSRGFESFSYAALESLAAGRPVVATATGALPEIIEHEQTGLIVPAADPRAMAAAMDRLLSDRTYSEQLGAAGFESARQRCHTPRVLPQILQTYEEATNFYSHVQAARSERTALQWRSAIDEARRQLDLERDAAPPSHPIESSDPTPMQEFLPPQLDVA